MWELLADLKAQIEAETAHMVFREPHAGRVDFLPETYCAPLVVVGQLPPKRQGEDQGEDFPYIIIRLARGKNDEKDGVRSEDATVRIFCGIATAGNPTDGVMEITVMMRAVKRLIATRKFWAGHRWERTFPVAYECGVREADNAQPHPYGTAYIDATFTTAGVVDDLDTETQAALGLGD